MTKSDDCGSGTQKATIGESQRIQKGLQEGLRVLCKYILLSLLYGPICWADVVFTIYLL